MHGIRVHAFECYLNLYLALCIRNSIKETEDVHYTCACLCVHVRIESYLEFLDVPQPVQAENHHFGKIRRTFMVLHTFV